MKSLKFILTIVTVYFLPALIFAGDKKEAALEPDFTAWSYSESEDGQIWVEVSYMFIGEPGFHLEIARNFYVEKNYSDAAGSIRKAAAYLAMFAEHEKSAYKKDLQVFAKDLLKLAKKIETNKVKSVDEIDKLLARVFKGLAGYSAERSKASQAKKIIRKSGHELIAALKYMELGIKASGKKMQEKTKNILKKARGAASKMKKGKKAKEENIKPVWELEYWGADG